MVSWSVLLARILRLQYSLFVKGYNDDVDDDDGDDDNVDDDDDGVGNILVGTLPGF